MKTHNHIINIRGIAPPTLNYTQLPEVIIKNNNC